jgi:DNA invertase Pin-like site-specific DNA recombinase
VTIGIYERVSSRGQRLDGQHADLQTWAKAQEAGGATVKWCSDVFTGKTLDRPGMTKLLADLRAGRVKTVVVWRLDRLGRTAKGLTTLLDELVTLKVNFVSLKDGIDLGTPAGRLIANVLASVAAYETEVRGERIAAGKAAKAAKAEAIIRGGGTPPPVNKGGRPKGTPNKVTPTVAGMIFRMKAQNVPVARIARELRLSRQTVYEVLARDCAKGDFTSEVVVR